MTDEQPDKQQQEADPQERIEQLEEQLKRVSADYQNYRRRTEQQHEQARKRAAKQLIKELLSVVDNLELALSQADEDDGMYQGVELVLGQLISVLEDQGVKRVPTDEFDPQHHEAVMSAHSDKPEGAIIDIMQHGYLLAGNVLRTAKVKVSKGEQDNE